MTDRARAARSLLGTWTVLVLVFLYVPLAVVVINSFNTSRTFVGLAPPASRRSGGSAAWHSQGARDALLDRRSRRPRRDRDRAGARHDGRARRAAVPVLRPRDRLVCCHPADRAARHRHRHRAQRDVHLRARRDAGPGDGDRRPRDVLHRHRLQQHAGPAAAAGHPTSRRRRPTSALTAARRSAT